MNNIDSIGKLIHFVRSEINNNPINKISRNPSEYLCTSVTIMKDVRQMYVP